MGALAVPPSVMVTRSDVWLTPGIGLSKVELIQLKIVELAPMPSASVSIAMAAKPGDFLNIRRLYRKSASKTPISLLCLCVTALQLQSKLRHRASCRRKTFRRYQESSSAIVPRLLRNFPGATEPGAHLQILRHPEGWLPPRRR